MANTVTAPVRAVADTTAQFTAGLAGRPSPMPAPTLTMPRVRDTSAGLQVVGAGGPPRAAAPRGGRSLAQANFDNPANNAPAAAPVVAAAAPAASAAPRAGDPNSFTFSDGRTVSVAGAGGVQTAAATPTPSLRRGTEPAPASAFDANAAVAPAVAAQRDVANLVRGNVAGGLRPGSTQDELIRRLANSQGSYFNKGRPSARAAEAAALTGQMAALTGAESQFQRGAGDAINAGAVGAVRHGLEAQEAAARSRFQRQTQDGQRELLELAQSEGREVVGSDGTLLLRRGEQATPVTDPTGKPIRMPLPEDNGRLTPKDLLEAYTAERETIAGSLASPEEKAAALAGLDANPLYRPLLGQDGGGRPSPSLDAFLEAARKQNPRKSEAELAAYYRATYGAPGGGL
ncbi:hypothetical protein [Arenimonas sp.]|uniref:hypothetical protein n=1 Tax=Arenimonas sp. TaxID=1872635 RepID=UPI0035B33EEF